jgi:hypothetical protein
VTPTFSEPFIERIDRPIAAICNARAGVEQQRLRLDDGIPLRSHEILERAHRVRRRLGPLEGQHRRHVQLRKARIIRRRDDFVMRQCRPHALALRRGAQVGDGIQRLAHRAVAVNVNVRIDVRVRQLLQRGAQDSAEK